MTTGIGFWWNSAVAWAFVLTLVATEARSQDAQTCRDNSDPDRQSAVTASGFMVASAHPLATQTGCDVLKSGGSAVDAAVAVQAVLSVVEPMASGIAGGAVITFWDAESRQVRVFEGLSGAPSRVTAGLRTPTEEDRVACGLDEDENFSSAVEVTARAFGVPGALRALEMAHDNYGRKEWNALFEPAIDAAEEGYPVLPYLHQIMGESTRGLTRCAYPDLAARYCDADGPLPVGTLIENPDLAQVLREIRDGGAGAFYDPGGTIAPAIVERLTGSECRPEHDEASVTARPATIPSLVTVEDFATYRARERTPLCRSVMNSIVCSSPPPTFGGIAVLSILGMLERGDIGSLDLDSLEYAHLFIEASRLVQWDRRQHVGDPEFNNIPVSGLLDPAYLDERYALFSPDSAVDPVVSGAPLQGVPLGDTRGVEDMTSHVTIVDDAGNVLSMTTTNNTSFGAQLEVRGMVLNNVMTNFTRPTSPSPGQIVNGMAPRKKARTAIAPSIVFDPGGSPRLGVGAAGGGAIPDYIVRTILGVMLHDLDPQAAINQPHFSGQALTGDCNGQPGPRSEVEEGAATEALLDGLNGLEHPCARAQRLRSGLTAIEIRPDGTLRGGADFRRDGTVMGE